MKTKSMILFLLFIITLVVGTQFKTNISEAAPNAVRIPDEAIRLRILADSNSSKDQQVKREIRDVVNAEIMNWVGELTNLQTARDVIKNHLPEIKTIVKRELTERNIDQNFTVTFGDTKFPTKMYGNYVYPAGIYESLVITLGKGQGANWWCVLFPPLCFLDFENGDAVRPASASEEDGKGERAESDDETKRAEDQKQVEVKFFVVEWVSSLFDAIKNLF